MPSFTQQETTEILEKRGKDEPITTNMFRQMMFVSGEPVEPSAETNMLVEQIVQQQVMEMVCNYYFFPTQRIKTDMVSYENVLLSARVAVVAASQQTTS